MKKKIVNSLIAATLTGTMMAGMVVPCFAEDKDNGGSITVLVESGSPAEALANNTAADFEKETGCKVVIDASFYRDQGRPGCTRCCMYGFCVAGSICGCNRTDHRS